MLKPGITVTEEDLKRAENRVKVATELLHEARENARRAHLDWLDAMASETEIKAAIKYNEGIIK